jgi:acyl-coenzyme A thioesterase PaaI-like protein
MTPSTYPPEQHVMRDLQIVTYWPADDRSMAIAPVGEHVRNAAGAACLGLIVTLTDVSGATVALAAAAPDWPATADLSYQAIGPIREGPALAQARLVRRGSHTVVIGVDVFDGLGGEDLSAARPAGAGLMTFGRIPREAAAVTVDRSGTAARRSTLALPGSRLTEPLLERIGLRVVDGEAGHVELPRSDYVRNSFGTINGGVMGMSVQGAAESALARTDGPLVATDVQLHYLAQVRSGPLRTSARILRVGGDHAVCHVRAVDAGQDGLVMAVASVTLQRW